MRRSNHLITTSEALRRVFLPHPNSVSRTYTTHPILKHADPAEPTRPQCLFSRPRSSPLHPQQYHINTSTTNGGRMVQMQSYAKAGPNGKIIYGPKDGPDRRPRDEEIDAFKVYMVRPEDDRLTEPRFLTEVLDARERDEKGRPTQFVQQVSPRSEERPYPVCKMYDKKAAREAEEAKRKASKASKMKLQSKQLEVSWAVSDNDLGHRLARLKEFLEKGWRVEIIFGSKRKSGWMERKEASLEEANKVLEKIRKVVGEVKGAQERQMQGVVGKEAILSFEGKAKK